MQLPADLNKDASGAHEGISLALEALGQKLCRHFVRIAIMGQRGRKVAVLLTPLVRESLEALTNCVSMLTRSHAFSESCNRMEKSFL